MNDLSKAAIIASIALPLIVIVFGICLIFIKTPDIQSENFGGNLPMEVYQIYDRDTGVYYLLTYSGDVTVMYNADGTIKTVDNGASK